VDTDLDDAFGPNGAATVSLCAALNEGPSLHVIDFATPDVPLLRTMNLACGILVLKALVIYKDFCKYFGRLRKSQ
jgi:hypothetical protein